MIGTFRQFGATLFVAASLGFIAASRAYANPPFDLGQTQGMEHFGGSEAAKALLATNGFVVADPAFKQIFEPYIGNPLPSFITPDSAWHTYHVLLEEGVKELETIQSQRLVRFSRLLRNAAIERQRSGDSAAAGLASYASVGLAFQDAQHCQSLGPEEKSIVEGLRSNAVPVKVPIGFDLSPGQFRAQSFYTQSSELRGYFAARTWYAGVAFRFKNSQETRMAVTLSLLIKENPELYSLWMKLSEPFDVFLAPAEDGTIPVYARAVEAVLGAGPHDAAAINQHLAGIQTKLASQLADLESTTSCCLRISMPPLGLKRRAFAYSPRVVCLARYVSNKRWTQRYRRECVPPDWISWPLHQSCVLPPPSAPCRTNSERLWAK